MNNKVTEICVADDPKYFKTWFKLAMRKYPNATTLYCEDVGLKTLHCPGIKKVYCANNKLTFIYAPDATFIDGGPPIGN
jgi:hypothetical protein